MSDQLKLTMRQLAQMALGTPILTDDNITILHSLFDLLLKKLNCTEETVSIGGFESKSIAEILQQTKESTLPFDDQGVELIEEQLDRIVKLEERIDSVSAKLEQHYEQIRINARANDQNFEPTSWERYALYCEDLCTTYEPQNQIPCNLLRNPDFMRKLQQIISPLVNRVKYFENEIETLYNEFTKFSKYAEEQHKKVALIGRLIREIEELRTTIGQNSGEFEETAKEILSMIQAKVDKQHLPILKKAVARRFDEMAVTIKRFEKQVERERKASHQKVKIGNDKCLSCGRTKVCDDKLNQNDMISKPKDLKKTSKEKRIFCGCEGYLCMSRKRLEPNFSHYTLTMSHSKHLIDASQNIKKRNVLFGSIKQSLHDFKNSSLKN